MRAPVKRCSNGRSKFGRLRHGYLPALVPCMNDGGRKARRCRYCGFCKGCGLRHSTSDDALRARRVTAGHAGAIVTAASRQLHAAPLDELRTSRNEADKDAAYYLSKHFTKCEWCGTFVAGFVTCSLCDDKIAGRVPEAIQRDNDVSDVRRILMEL